MSDESHDHVVPGSEEALDSEDVAGYDFRGDFDFFDMLSSYETTGFQATHLYEAVELIRAMREEGAEIYLTFTSNIVSSGLRETLAYLTREDLVDVMITTSGSITEDVIKTEKPFKMGEWDVDEAEMRERGINRLGNIFVPSDRYVWLESYLNDFFEDFFAEEKRPHADGVLARTRRDAGRRGFHPLQRRGQRHPHLLPRADRRGGRQLPLLLPTRLRLGHRHRNRGRLRHASSSRVCWRTRRASSSSAAASPSTTPS